MASPSNSDIPYYYIWVYSKLKRKSWNDPMMSTKDVLNTIKDDCRATLMPSNMVYHMLSQMEDLGLIKRIHRLKYEILNSNVNMNGFDKGEDHNKKKDEFQKSIENINKLGKVRVEDDSLYKILPSKEIKKLDQLNCWFVKA